MQLIHCGQTLGETYGEAPTPSAYRKPQAINWRWQ
jgi:hypothetical protein